MPNRHPESSTLHSVAHPPEGDRENAVGVRLRGARLAYDGAPLLAGLDLDLAAGTWTCLLGPSGVGKSSLLRLIAGLAPDAGADDLAATDGRPLARRVAYMAQQDLLLPWLTARQNVQLGRRLRGQRADHRRADELLEQVGLTARADALPAALSGGERQRAALARTLMEDRPIVLMDEPFSALDALTRHQLQDLAARLLGGRTVLLVTHDPLEALRLGDRVLVLTGRPAHFQPALVPAGAPPRETATAEMAGLHRQLLTLLGVGQAAA